MSNQRTDFQDRQLSVVAMAIPLLALAVFIRGWTLYYPVQSYWEARGIIRGALHSSYYDIMTIFGATLLASVALLFLRLRTRVQSAIVRVYYVFAALMGLLLCINSRALEIIGGSLTYQWLYYADFLRSFTSRSAIASALDVSLLTLFSISFLALTAGQWGLKALFRTWSAGLFHLVIGPGTLLVVAYLAHGQGWVRSEEKNYREIANPMIELLATAFAGDANRLSSLPTGSSDIDFRIGSAVSASKSQYNANRLVKNVILIVMESVGADYVIGSRQFAKDKLPIEVTPELTKARAASVTFDNYYAHTPMSTKSLFSILASRYPLFSYETEISRVGKGPLTTLSSRLKEAGYRTAFFMSGDFRFQGVDQFLKGRGFDVLSDMSTIPCNTPAFVGSTTAWSNLDSVDDECTAAALSKWIGDGRGPPFFGMIWTGNTHWPYFVHGEQFQISNEKPHFNRYLNALRSTDAAIGKIFGHLDANSLWNETLVVVIGDHGEAFGQHGSQVHGNSIFEEEVHIPLLLLSPTLFRGEHNEGSGGLVDLAPTILDLLKIEAPLAWQGRSMFAIERPARVYFMVPNSEMIAGYKEGDLKFIFNTARNKASIFDLRSDPGEARNLVGGMPDAEKEIPDRLAAWVQYQTKLFSSSGAASQ
jgi:lipoteichoic acid synthase